MLVLLRQSAENPLGIALAAIALREALADSTHPIVAIDAANLVHAANATLTPDLEARLLSVAEPVIDDHHAHNVRRFIITIPVGAEERLPRLALLFTRRHDQRCFALRAPDGAGSRDACKAWAGETAARLRAHHPLLSIEPWRPMLPEITTPRLRLGLASRPQLEAYLHAIAGSSIFDNLIWDGPSSPVELLDFQWRGLQEWARGALGHLHWSIIETSSDACIGGCGFRVLHRDPGRLEIGYVLAPASHARGYATEAVGAMLSWIFKHRAPDRVQAHVYVGNDASKRVLEKVGFAYEGLLRANTPKRGTRKDEWLYAITRDEWQERLKSI
jgi:RimJ/RimL family protein N-acetyltransferase